MSLSTIYTMAFPLPLCTTCEELHRRTLKRELNSKNSRLPISRLTQDPKFQLLGFNHQSKQKKVTAPAFTNLATRERNAKLIESLEKSMKQVSLNSGENVQLRDCSVVLPRLGALEEWKADVTGKENVTLKLDEVSKRFSVSALNEYESLHSDETSKSIPVTEENEDGHEDVAKGIPASEMCEDYQPINMDEIYKHMSIMGDKTTRPTQDKISLSDEEDVAMKLVHIINTPNPIRVGRDPLLFEKLSWQDVNPRIFDVLTPIGWKITRARSKMSRMTDMLSDDTAGETQSGGGTDFRNAMSNIKFDMCCVADAIDRECDMRKTIESLPRIIQNKLMEAWRMWESEGKLANRLPDYIEHCMSRNQLKDMSEKISDKVCNTRNIAEVAFDGLWQLLIHIIEKPSVEINFDSTPFNVIQLVCCVVAYKKPMDVELTVSKLFNVPRDKLLDDLHKKAGNLNKTLLITLKNKMTKVQYSREKGAYPFDQKDLMTCIANTSVGLLYLVTRLFEKFFILYKRRRPKQMKLSSFQTIQYLICDVWYPVWITFCNTLQLWNHGKTKHFGYLLALNYIENCLQFNNMSEPQKVDTVLWQKVLDQFIKSSMNVLYAPQSQFLRYLSNFLKEKPFWWSVEMPLNSSLTPQSVSFDAQRFAKGEIKNATAVFINYVNMFPSLVYAYSLPMDDGVYCSIMLNASKSTVRDLFFRVGFDYSNVEFPRHSLFGSVHVHQHLQYYMLAPAWKAYQQIILHLLAVAKHQPTIHAWAITSSFGLCPSSFEGPHQNTIFEKLARLPSGILASNTQYGDMVNCIRKSVKTLCTSSELKSHTPADYTTSELDSYSENEWNIDGKVEVKIFDYCHRLLLDVWNSPMLGSLPAAMYKDDFCLKGGNKPTSWYGKLANATRPEQHHDVDECGYVIYECVDTSRKELPQFLQTESLLLEKTPDVVNENTINVYVPSQIIQFFTLGGQESDDLSNSMTQGYLEMFHFFHRAFPQIETDKISTVLKKMWDDVDIPNPDLLFVEKAKGSINGELQS